MAMKKFMFETEATRIIVTNVHTEVVRRVLGPEPSAARSLLTMPRPGGASSVKGAPFDNSWQY